jgi:iron complex transport system substrate-binding protein
VPSPTPEPTEADKSLVITDGLGREIIFKEPAQRIVSIAPSNTEILFAVGAGEQIVARDSFSDFPEEAQAVTDIGGGWGEIDTETIISLEPDLVLAAEINAPEQVQSLEDLGLTVFYLGNPNNLEGLYENLLIVAQITGHEDEAEVLITDLKNRVSSVQEKIAQVENRPLVFYELDGTDPSAPWTSGPATFIDMLLTMAGGTNLGNVLDSAWAQISVEELVSQNPDVILLGDYIWGGITPEDVAARAGWEGIAAVQDGQVYPFDDNLVSRPGPRMVDGLEELAKILHPELFK